MELQSENINELAAALAIAQGTIETAHFDKVNPHFKNQYASYDSIRKTCQKALSENGLCITQMLSMSEKGRMLITQLSHKSGQWIRSEIILPAPERETPQGVGSSITYAKRYALAALLCIGTGEDDDGEEAEKSIEEMITPEEAQKIEDMISYDPEYRSNMLKYLGEVHGIKGATSFKQLPRKSLTSIHKSISRKLEAKNP